MIDLAAVAKPKKLMRSDVAIWAGGRLSCP